MRNDGRIREFFKKYGMQILVTVCLLLAVSQIPFNAYYERTFAGTEFGETETGAETGDATLQDGSYRVRITADSQGDENYLEVYSSRKLNPDNTQGAVIARVGLKQEERVTEFSFTATESMEDIRFRLVCGDGGTVVPEELYLISENMQYTDIFWLMGLVLLVSFVIFWRRRTGRRLDAADRTAFLLLTAAVVMVSLPLTFDSLLNGHDLYYHFNRILGIQEGLKSGQFPVKIHSSMLHGYGYGSPIFYPELFLYIPAALGCLGVSLINCYKAFVVLIHAATAWIAYRSFSGVLKSREMGTLAALLYTLSVYRLTDVYTRAAVGEALGMVFLPLVLWGMYELFLGDAKKWYLAALGFTGIMQSHVLLTELTVIFGALFALASIRRLKEKGRFSALMLAGVSTVLMNLGVLLPIFHHMGYPFKVFADNRTLSQWTVTLPKIFDFVLDNPLEGLTEGVQNSGEMAVSLGFVLLPGILCFLYAYLRQEKKSGFWKYSFRAFLLGMLGIYLSTNLFPWDLVQRMPLISHLLTSVQFPWRFLALSSALLCPVSAAGFYHLTEHKETRKAVFLAASALAFLCAGIYTSRYCEETFVRYSYLSQYQKDPLQVDALYYIDEEGTEGYGIWDRENTFEASEGLVLSDCARSENLTAGFHYTRTGGTGEAWVDAPFNYYPNYKAFDENGEEVPTGCCENGVVRVYLPDDAPAEGTIRMMYREPWYYHLGRLLSAVSFLGVAGFAVGSRRMKCFPGNCIRKQK